MQAERIRLMVTAMSYPSISRYHFESICVAGIRMGGPHPEQVRLFPIPYRDLAPDKRFSKYDVIDIDVTRPTKDDRPESRRPRPNTLKIIGPVSTARQWNDRAQWVHPLVAPSLCHIKRQQTIDGTSMGVFRPARVTALRIAKVERRPAGQRATQIDLIYPDRKPLETLPCRFVYRFRCEDTRCSGHEMSLIDWEIGADYLRWRSRSPQLAEAKIREKWFTQATSDQRDLYFFTGNLLGNRRQFVLGGTFCPPLGTMDQLELF